MSTEPIREALIDVLMHAGYDEEGQADAILAAFDVRPRGTVAAPADDVREAVDNVRRYMDAALTVGHTAAQYRLIDGGLSTLFHSDLHTVLPALAGRSRGTVTDAERYATALRAIADGDGPDFVREFARDALAQGARS